jgi:Fe2+ or Zn2+ uptake regulation protein
LEDVYLENDLEKAEMKLEKDKNIKIEKHSLEFFGLCNNCI